MPNFLNLCVTLTSVLVLFSSFTTNISANYTFNSDFDAGFDSWKTIPDHMTPTIESSFGKTYARFTAPYGLEFPFIAHSFNNDFISQAEFEFNYIQGGASQGSGVMLSNIIPDSNQNPPNDSDNYSVGLWNIGSDFYIVSPLCDNIGGCGISIYSRAVFKLPDLSWNIIRFSYHENELEITLNNSSRKLPYGSIHKKPIGFLVGNPVHATNSQNWLPFSLANVSITYGDALEVNDFPYLSQKDPLWKDVVYDNASVWAGDQANTIERWGCAITSVAMVLREYGVKMPNGDEANPDKINDWLLSQPDGYIGNGLLNWLAISRMTRESRESGHADKDLEFTKSFASPSDELTAGLFPIIDEGGHFVTLFDQSEDSYLLNDPNNATRSSKLKSELIRSVNTYYPSNTDLSYIMIVTDPLIDINATYSGSAVGTKYDEEISDDVGSGGTGPGRILYIPKPSAGDYTLTVSNTKSDEGPIKIYSYDTNGNVDVTTQPVTPGSSNWVVSYNPDGTDPTISELDTTPPSYTGTNSFTGWYNQPQIATFSFADPNMPSDFVSPTCTISREGKNRTCSVNVLVCDKYNNCASHNLTSNPANIDLRPPGRVKHVWGIGVRPFSLISWTPSRDATKYIVNWGTDKSSLTNQIETRDNWLWLPTPKVRHIYVKVTAADRAGNLSKASQVEKINVTPYYWRW